MKKKRHILPISGKDSAALAVVCRALWPEIDFEFCFNATGSEYPEMIEWLESIEKALGITILRFGADLMAKVEGYNYFLPNANNRYCTRESKIEPFEEWIGDSPAVAYFGIRADEDRGGYDNSKTPWIEPRYPLKELGIGLKEVYTILKSKGLMPPRFIWRELVETVSPRFPGMDLEKQLGEIAYYMLFSGRTRANCYHCFFQKQYEFCWLYYAHRELFDKSERCETLGSKAGQVETIPFFGTEYEFTKGERSFTWMNGTSLAYVRANHRKILLQRAAYVEKQIRKALGTGQLDLNATLGDEKLVDTLNVTSCGLFCGK